MSERLKYCDICGISEVEGIISGKSTELIPIAVIIEDEAGSVEACPSCAAEAAAPARPAPAGSNEAEAPALRPRPRVDWSTVPERMSPDEYGHGLPGDE